MKFHRRRFLHLAADAAALPTVSRVAWSQAYPTRPVRVVVGFAAGGPTDIVARLMGQWLSERSGQQFVIENRPGAGSDIATEVVVRAPPDGYTLLVFGILTAIEKMRSQKRYDPKALVDWYVKLARVRGWPNDTPTSTRNVRTLSRSVPTCRV